MNNSRLAALDPFTIAALLVLLVASYTFYNSFLNRNFPVFTEEDQIDEVIQAEFPLFVDYL